MITGATSGIGKACAEAFANQNGTIIVSGRNTERGNQVVKSLAGKGHRFLACDVGDRQQSEQLIEDAIAAVGHIDVLVNSAGVVHHHTVLETTNAIWDETMAVNVSAIFYLCRATIPHMIKHGGGSIVNIASTWGLVGAESTAAYCASKGAVIQLTRCMALDHALQNVRVNAVCPGAVDTPMMKAEAKAFGMTDDEARVLWGSAAANKKIASAEEVAFATTFLASDGASHIHGVALPVDGGSVAA